MNRFDTDERNPRRRPEISDGRKTAYYIGIAITIFGFLMFLSVFVTGALNFGNFDNFAGRARNSGLRAVGGMVLIIVGSIIRGIGARGLAGSGVVLDPHQARDDLHPYTNAAGGMVRDVLDGADIDLPNTEESQVILIRCNDCRKLNEETDKFCSECGASLL